MRRLTSIVAVNKQGVIGVGNALPWRVKSDMQFFKKVTTGNVVIMGRKTHDSLGQCLPNRHNVVVSHQFALFENTASCVLEYGIFDALLAAEKAPQSFDEIFVIGGASMYAQFSGLVDRYLITVINKAVPHGDAFFDEGIVGNDADWEIEAISAGTANSSGDEADFEIFELNARDADRRQQTRAIGIAEIRDKVRSAPRRGSAPRTANRSDQHQFSLSMIG